ncbi:MAG: DUF2085 domain-containing protein [Ktedonobacteraceae bacterium]
MAIEQVQPTVTLSGSARQHAFTQFMSRLALHIGNFLLQHWATLLTTILGILVFLALSVPLLFYFGLDDFARPIYFSLHYVCAQIPSHSFYIYGHPLGLCERNFSIYTSMFLGSAAFVLSRKRLPGIPWWLWLLIILPMAADGVTQMFGLRESTPLLRVITGTLFGLGNVWFVLPLVQRNIADGPSLLSEAPGYYQPSPPMAPINYPPTPSADKS